MKKHFTFILVEPATPGNIGSAARAIKTMGFSDLRLVNPTDHLQDEARWLAHGANDILENARLFQSLQKACQDLDLIIGTTAKNRSVKIDYYDTHQIRKIIEEKGNTIQKIGIVFGREESGLSNEELQLCHIASSVPLAAKYPSINLAQSVMIYAHILSPLVLNIETKNDNKNSSDNANLILLNKAEKLINQTKISRNTTLTNRLLERLAVLKQDDIRLVLSVLKAIQPEKQE